MSWRVESQRDRANPAWTRRRLCSLPVGEVSGFFVAQPDNSMPAFLRLQMIVLAFVAVLPMHAVLPTGNPGELVVRGTIPHCKALPNDPQDKLPLPRPGPYTTIMPDEAGPGFHLIGPLKSGAPNDMTHRDVWLRGGNALGDFIFRAPQDGTPFCIGARSVRPKGYVQLKHSMFGKDYACKYLRFSLFVASRKAEGTIWLNGGDHAGGGAYNTFVAVPIPKKMAWTPVMLQVGPVDRQSHWVGYGVVLGKGDVWFVQPKFEVIPNSELARYHRKEIEDCEHGNSKQRWQEDDGVHL
jgi:hypothetical protein